MTRPKPPVRRATTQPKGKELGSASERVSRQRPLQNATQFLSVAETAQYLGVASKTLEEWRREGANGPAFHKLGRRVMYRVADLERWIDSCRVEPWGDPWR